MTRPPGDDGDPAPGGDAAPSRWWLNPALAHLAFGASARADPSASVSMASAMFNALQGMDATTLDLDDPAQRTFGDYELLEQIGQGGMGMVFRARQQRLDREVALKLLSAGAWAPEPLVDSLRREAQHAAQLQHANIVTVFEMGEHEGLIFYAMQLVRGRSLSQQLGADGPLPPREAARLLRTVAEAVDYAHRLGVLHLDLKPGNILIDGTPGKNSGAPLVTDFGLARRIEQALERDNISGTPSYLAPEQARTDGPPLTPATDVWALGAVLYETLTGHPPFDSADAADTVRLLLGAEVRKPTRYLPLPADLEAICLHCLEKDPARRYPDARALADDLGRFLEGRAVGVRPLNAAQRLWRWARREPKVAIMAGLAVAALTIGLAASLWQWRRAAANASEAMEINRFLNEDVLASAEPSVENGQDPSRITVPALLADAEARLDGGRIKNPTVRAQIGLSIAQAYFGLGLWDRAWKRLKNAHRYAIMAAGHDSPLALDIEERLGVAATYGGHYDEAAQVYAHLIPIRTAQAGANAPTTIRARLGYALYLSETDRFQQAASEFESIRTTVSALAPNEINDVEWNLSDLYTEINRWDDAERQLRDVLERSRRHLGPDNLQYLWESLSLVDLLNMRARWDEAAYMATRNRNSLVRSLGPEHPKALTATHYLGQIALERGDPEHALPLLQEALRGRIRAHGESHKWTQYTANRVGQTLIALGREQEGIAMLEHTLELATREGRRQQAYVLLILDNLARGYISTGNLDRAEAYLDEGLANARASLPADNVRRGMLERSLGELREHQGKSGEAIAHYMYAKRVFTGLRPDHPWVLDLNARIARLKAGKPDVIPAKG